MPESARAFKNLMREHDALGIASPEYNGSFAALLKNAIDWATQPDRRTAAGGLPGQEGHHHGGIAQPSGNQRGLRHVRELLEMIHVKTLPAAPVASAAQAFDAEGGLVRAEDRAALDRLAEDLARALDAGRFAAA